MLPSRLLFVSLVLALTASLGSQCQSQKLHEDAGNALFTSPQVDGLALSNDGSRLYVPKTMSNVVKVIDTASRSVTQVIPVGVDPVSVEMRPDGNELWVANHVSDSISVIDTNPASPTFHEVVGTIQDLDANGVSAFDEPVDVAFASNSKAYVSLSSRNDIAVIDVATRSISKRVHITAQEPRALAVAGGRLYVAAFESGNQSEVSACPNGNVDGEPPENCTLGIAELAQFVIDPNIPGATKNIVIDPDVPDRDLFWFDTTDESPVNSVEHVGTLLYGLAVSSNGTVFVAQTGARNADNGIDGANLIDLQNRIFLNQIAVVDCSGGGSCSFDPATDVHDLEESPGTSVTTPLATPYAIAVSGDDSTLVVTAAASSRIATIDATNPGLSGILGTVDVGDIPRSVELVSDGTGAPQTAYVLNNLGNTISVVDVSEPTNLSVTATIGLGGASIPLEVRRGRIAFNDADASDSGTFACASCHPDGNTDQLLWRIGGACFFGACSGDDEPRTTMPIRGLDNTLPLHWDGTLGDPFGGGNGAVGGGGSGGTDCSLGGPDGDHDCFRDLVNESLAGVMCDQSGGCGVGPSGLAGRLSEQEREDMAFFLESVWYPPARERRVDDTLSASAANGFRDFFMDQGGGGPSTCADSQAGCHALPLMADTNSATLNGFDVPTMRGLNDRFLQFSLGVSAADESLKANADPAFPYSASDGLEENVVFGAAFPLVFTPVYGVGPTDIFQMVEEAGTGTSGALGRQIQLEGVSTDYALLSDLEAADERGGINLRGDGVFNGTPRTVSYLGSGLYQVGPDVLSRAQLEAEVDAGNLRAVLTGLLPLNFGSSTHPQPFIAPPVGAGPTGNPNLDFSDPLPVVGTGVRLDAIVLVDGAPVGGSVSCTQIGDFCADGNMSIDFAAGVSNGMHLVQLQNPKGPLSNELPVCEGPTGGCN